MISRTDHPNYPARPDLQGMTSRQRAAVLVFEAGLASARPTHLPRRRLDPVPDWATGPGANLPTGS